MSAARYFQGNSVTGPVRESAARNFKEVVDALRICPVIPSTRDAFLALPKKERNEKKQVPFFVPATFKSSPSKRVYAEAVHCNLIFLDIDELPDGRCPAAPFVRDPALLERHLHGFNFAAHLTASSTALKPRMRVIVDAHEILLGEYPKAVATIGALLGLPVITRESSVAVQPMFLPTLFADSPEDETPLLAYKTDQRQFLLSDISDSLDSYNGSNGTKSHSRNGHTPDFGGDALDFLRAPVQEITLQVAEQLLKAIDPSCKRDEWIMCAAALRHQFSPHKDAEAFELFDEWSKESEKYQKEDDIKATWRSIRPSPIGRLPITIRSLVKLATENGWDDKKVKENCFSGMVRWLEETPNVMDLLERGAQRILATPLLTSMQEDVLVTQLCAQAKRRFSYTVSPTAVRKDIGRLREEMKAQAEPAEKVKEPKWAEGVCYIQATKEFYRYKTGEKLTAEAFNAAYGRHLMPTEKMLKEAGTPVTPASLSTPFVLPKDYALNFLKIPTVYDYAYDPAQPTDVFFINRGSRFVNTYSATYPQLDPKNAKMAGELLQRHLHHLIGDEVYIRILLDFMAFQVQVPGRKVRWAVLIQGTEGAGKTFLAEVMQAVLGTEHVKVIDGGSISSGWNEWAFGKQMVVIEEVKVDGTNKYEVMNSLKHLITNKVIPINERFRNTRQVDNITNYIMFSNHHDALALTPGDRRYFVIKSPLQTKSQVLALGDDYFPPLYAMLRDHAGGLRSFFADWEISPDFRADGHAPRTKYVQDMVNDSANDVTATIRRMLMEGDLPLVQYDIVSASILKTALQHEEGFPRVTAQQIAQILREEGLQQAGRHLIGDERMYLWARPGIPEAVAAELASDRAKRNLCNLGMDLLF